MADGGGDPAPTTSTLRRSVTTVTATATSAGLAFAAIDYLGVVSVLAYAPGATAALAILVGGLLVVLVAGIFSEPNGLYPSAAGIRLYLGRALGQRAVDLPGNRTIEIVRRADQCLDAHIARVDQQRDCIAHAAVGRMFDVILDLPLEYAL